MGKNNIKKVGAIFCANLLAATVLAPIAHAQEATKQTGDTAVTEAVPGEILVTATRRQERLKDIPLSISALSGDTLQQDRITSFQDLSRNIPAFSASNFGGPGTSNLQIRGVSSKAGTATVATYLDDVSLTTRNSVFQGTAEPRFFDIQRVEVLRGPQGTLFGASALGGAIRFISNQPNLSEFQGEVFGELSGTQHGGTNYTARAVVNVPLVEGKVALRVGAEAGETSGYVDYVGQQTTQVQANNNRNRWYVGRVSLRAEPTDNFSITPAFFGQKNINRNLDVISEGVPGFVNAKPVREPSEDLLLIPSLTVNWDAGPFSVTSVSTYYYRKFLREFDETAFYVPYLSSIFADSNPALSNVLAQQATPGHYLLTTKQFTQELRIASPSYDGSSPFTWVVGAFYQEGRDRQKDTTDIVGLRGIFDRFGVDYEDPAGDLGGFPGAFDDDRTYDVDYFYKSRQFSLFGELTVYPTSNIRLTVGGRYIWAKDSLDQYQNYWISGCGLTGGPGCPYVISGSLKSNAFTPKFAVGWDVTPDVTFYATAAKGFRLGGASTPLALYGNAASPGVPAQGTIGDLTNLGYTTSNVPNGYQPDSVWNYEAGVKAELFDRHLTFNLSGFRIDWSNIQQTINLPLSGFTLQGNAGRARIYGFELETRARLGGLTAGLALGYTHARLPDGVSVNGILLNGTSQNAVVVGVPDWTAAGTLEYRREIAPGVASFIRGSVQYVGESRGSLVATDADFVRPSYTTADASVGAEIDRVNVQLFVNNLTNNTKIIQRPNYFIYPQGYRIRPRTAGVNVGMKF